MEVFRAPRVTLIARPEFLEPKHLRVQWQGNASAGERLAEFAGRICYMSQHNPANRSTADYLENIKKQGHGSVLEHAVYVLLIEGISRSCSHELVRHRAGFGYSQISQRYVDESHAAFVMPPAVLGEPRLEEEWLQQVTDAQAAYVRAVDGLMQRYEWVSDKVHRRKMAHDARAPLRRGRRVGNPPYGDRCVARPTEGSGLAVLRLRVLRRRRQTGSRASHVSQSLKGVEQRRLATPSSKNVLGFSSTNLLDVFCRLSLAHLTLISYSDLRMRIGLAYNEKPDAPAASDAYAEWDDPSTIDAVEQALSLFGSVVRLEADELFPQKLSLAHPDIVFNMAEGLHGPCRESHVPALCEFLNIPYTGSDPLTLALTLHKGRTKEILAYRGVPTAPFRVIERVADLERMPLPYPLFVKPVAEGSGKGIFVNNLCETPAMLTERVPFLLDRYEQPVLVETYLPGPEFTVAILGNNGDVR